jgi:hypothetical protein
MYKTSRFYLYEGSLVLLKFLPSDAVWRSPQGSISILGMCAIFHVSGDIKHLIPKVFGALRQ